MHSTDQSNPKHTQKQADDRAKAAQKATEMEAKTLSMQTPRGSRVTVNPQTPRDAASLSPQDGAFASVEHLLRSPVERASGVPIPRLKINDEDMDGR